MKDEWEELEDMFDELGDGSLEDIQGEEEEESQGDEEVDNEDDNLNNEEEDNKAEEGKSDDEDSDTELEKGDIETKDDNGDSGDGHEDEHVDGKESDESGFQPIEITIDGTKVTANSIDELKQLAQRKKSTKMPSEAEVIMEQGKLSSDDLKLFVEAQNGSPEAIAEIARRANVDKDILYDAKAEAYKQSQNYNMPTEADIVANEIMADKGLHEKFTNAVAVVPKDFVQAITANAEDLRHFKGHLESGLAQEIIPEAMKQMMMKGGKFMDHYIDVGRSKANSEASKQVDKEPKKTTQRQRKANKDIDELRKRSNSNSKNGKRAEVDSDDVWQMSDSDFEAMFD